MHATQSRLDSYSLMAMNIQIGYFPQELKSCYVSALDLAKKEGIRTMVRSLLFVFGRIYMANSGLAISLVRVGFLLYFNGSLWVSQRFGCSNRP